MVVAAVVLLRRVALARSFSACCFWSGVSLSNAGKVDVDNVVISAIFVFDLYIVDDTKRSKRIQVQADMGFARLVKMAETNH